MGDKKSVEAPSRHIIIHCFEDEGPGSLAPTNSYHTVDKDAAVRCIDEILSNDLSGIAKIVIEDGLFKSVLNEPEAQNIREL